MSLEQIVPDGEIETQFLQSLEDNHIVPRYSFRLIMDGEIHRFSVKGNYSSETSGAYKIYPYGKRPCWYIQDFRQNNEMIKVLFDFERSSLSYEARRAAYDEANTPEAIAARKAKKEREARQKETERRAAYQRACEEYNYSCFTGALYHPYVKQKLLNIPIFSCLFEWDRKTFREWPSVSRCLELGVVSVPENGGPCKKGDLLIPLVDAETGIFKTLQIISSIPDERSGKYLKRFYRGLPKENACYKFIPAGWDKSPIIYLTEGFFTGYAVLLLTKLKGAVYCAMDSGNLEHVAASIRKVHPGKKIILMADDDKGTESKLAQQGNPGRNTGLNHAQEALKAGLVDKIKVPHIPNRGNVNIDWYDVLAKRQRIEALGGTKGK